MSDTKKQCPPAPKRESVHVSRTRTGNNRIPKIQFAQKCVWCDKYLDASDEITTYSGDNPDYEGWICHNACDLVYTKKIND